MAVSPAPAVGYGGHDMADSRTFERTHPWIDFSLDLRSAPYQLWMLLGEAQSKIEHTGSVPLRPDTAQELHRLYLAKGVLATTAIEGNTLTESQVIELLEGKLTLPPSRQKTSFPGSYALTMSLWRGTGALLPRIASICWNACAIG